MTVDYIKHMALSLHHIASYNTTLRHTTLQLQLRYSVTNNNYLNNTGYRYSFITPRYNNSYITPRYNYSYITPRYDYSYIISRCDYNYITSRYNFS